MIATHDAALLFGLGLLNVILGVLLATRRTPASEPPVLIKEPLQSLDFNGEEFAPIAV